MRNKLLNVLGTQFVMSILLFMMLFPQEGTITTIVRIACAAILLLYLPGFWVSYLFFHQDNLSAFERFMLSFLISLTLVILISYYLYFTKAQLSTIMIYLITFGLLLLSMLAVLIRWRGGHADIADENFLDPMEEASSST